MNIAVCSTTKELFSPTWQLDLKFTSVTTRTNKMKFLPGASKQINILNAKIKNLVKKGSCYIITAVSIKNR